MLLLTKIRSDLCHNLTRNNELLILKIRVTSLISILFNNFDAKNLELGNNVPEVFKLLSDSFKKLILFKKGFFRDNFNEYMVFIYSCKRKIKTIANVTVLFV